MTLLKNGINLSKGLTEFISISENLFIFVPYIKLEPLKQLLATADTCKIIIVRWETKDLILGSSDLEVYKYCIERNIKLYRNPRLHLKAFVDNYKKCLLGSANISTRALNIPEGISYNYELATIEETLSFDDRLYFSIIHNEATLITDSIYEQIKTQLSQKLEEFPNESDFNIKIKFPDKDFLISSLPMSNSVKTLMRVYLEKRGVHEEEVNCAMHDLALYELPLNLAPNVLRERLKDSFFNQSFIKAFLLNLENNGEIYFGSAKDWIHKNCADVPTPRKWEITENIQILYRWIVDLGEGKYKIDIPGAYSERLSIV